MDRNFTEILNSLSPKEQERLLRVAVREVRDKTLQEELDKAAELQELQNDTLESLDERLSKMQPSHPKYKATVAAHKAKLAQEAPRTLTYASDYAKWEQEREEMTAHLADLNANIRDPESRQEARDVRVQLNEHLKTKPKNIIPDPEPVQDE